MDIMYVILAVQISTETNIQRKVTRTKDRAQNKEKHELKYVMGGIPNIQGKIAI